VKIEAENRAAIHDALILPAPAAIADLVDPSKQVPVLEAVLRVADRDQREAAGTVQLARASDQAASADRSSAPLDAIRQMQLQNVAQTTFLNALQRTSCASFHLVA
jgi:hypothetical protein